MTRRTALVIAALPLSVVGLTACGLGSSGRPAATPVMADGRTMSGSAMPAEGAGVRGGMTGTSDHVGRARGPSPAAAMICSAEIRDAVARTLGLDRAPRGLHGWDGHSYRCSYLLGAGDLRLSVEDLDAPGPGRQWFEALRDRLPGATTLRGVAALGHPAFETARGDVVFLKDSKTLRVDAGRLSTALLPAGTSRQDVAYGVAAAVIACWSE